MARCPKGYVKSRKSKRCVFKTSNTGRKLSKRRASKKRSHKREGRPSPNVSATLFPVGTKKDGLDGNVWQVRKTSHAKRWVKVRT